MAHAAFYLLGLSVALSAFAQTPVFNSSTVTASAAPFYVTTADFNGDNKPDLLVAGVSLLTQTGSVEAFLNDGKGGFQRTASLALPKVASIIGDSNACLPFYVAAGDFARDGKQDILVVCSYSQVVLVYPGNGDGTFSTPTLSTLPYGVLAFVDELKIGIGDFNGDGFLDLAFSELSAQEAEDAATPLTGQIAVILGLGNGKFSGIKPVTTTTGGPLLGSTIAVGDLNKDGKLDMVISQPKNLSANVLIGIGSSPGPLQILLGKGDGTFTIGASIAMSFAPGPVTIADVNGDGKPDLIVDGFFNGLAVLLGNGDGTFKQTYNQNVGGGPAGSVQVVDLLGTGKPGLLLPVATCCSNQIVFLPGNGDGTFQNYIPIMTGQSSPDTAVADFNGDGKMDIAVSSFPVDLTQLAGLVLGTGGSAGLNFNNNVAILLNQGVGPALTHVNGASYATGPLAAGSIASVFAGSGLASGTDTPSSLPLPTTDMGASITVKDSFGSIRMAPLFYVSPTQINYQVPDNTAAGTATIGLNFMGQTYPVQQAIAAVQPGLFQANVATHLLSADVLTVHPDGSRVNAHSYQVDPQGNVVAAPVNLSGPGDQVFLTIYATGIKNAKTVTANIGTNKIPVTFAGPQGDFQGLDQVNIGPLPASLAGSGSVNLMITADGAAANVVNLAIR